VSRSPLSNCTHRGPSTLTNSRAGRCAGLAAAKARGVASRPPGARCSIPPRTITSFLRPLNQRYTPDCVLSWPARLSDLGKEQQNRRPGEAPAPPSPYALRRMRRPVNGRWRGSAKARALATQPNLAVVGNACGGRTDFHGNFQLMLLHCCLHSGRCPQGEQDR
jgi:hypothetical protein